MDKNKKKKAPATVVVPATSGLEQISIKATKSIGTPISIVIHTLFFSGIFLLYFVGFSLDNIMLILTTAVSLEAIYLAIFIQMTVNRNTASLEAVEDDIDEIQEDVEDITEDVEELSEEVEDISEDIDLIQEEDKQDGVMDQKAVKLLANLEKQLELLQKEVKLLKTIKKVD